VVAAAGARLLAYVTRDQAGAVIAAAATTRATRARLLFACLCASGSPAGG
jgi:hypothetical protein